MSTPGRSITVTGTGASISFSDTDDWGSGFVGSVSITNTAVSALNNWTIEFDLPETITDIWNATIVSHVGNHYVISNAAWNGGVTAGGTVSFGFQANGGNPPLPTSYTLNGAVISGSAPPPSPPPPPLPVISVQNITVHEPPVTGGTTTSTSTSTNLLPAGYLSTRGNQIVDQNGNPVKIAAVNWFGLESTTYAPQGLWAASYKTMMNQMVQLGFNAIRLPFSDQLFDSGSVPNGIDFSKNPDLQGLTGLQIMDKIVDYASQIGLKIILDHHRSAAGDGPNASGLWYDSGYSEARWISDWTKLAQHYAGNPTIIGADLANEPHGPATWGDGSADDWAAAATRAGDAIQAVNSNWLILVEGIESYNGQSTWWGGNLQGVASHPITLTDPNKLVYSPHDYPASVYPQTWFSASNYPNNLPSVWNQEWGYIYQQNIAPVLLGEFGTKLQTTSDQQWLTTLVNYLDGNGALTVPAGQQGPSWAYWSWNPNSGDTGGILQDDWQTVNTNKVNAIAPAMFHSTSSSGGTGMLPDGTASFTVSLSAASTQQVTVHYATVDGTAHAGVDYTAISGDLVFAPGETTKIVSTQLFAKPGETGQMQFLLALSNPLNATLSGPSATAILVHDTPVTTPPSATGSVALNVSSKWGSGYIEAGSITNTGSVSANGWQIEIDTPNQISNIWNAVIVSHQGFAYTIANASWNANLAPGASTGFGFEVDQPMSGTGPVAHVLKLGT